MFEGVYTALATPFLENGGIDFKGMERLISLQLERGVDGLVLLGTTAETPALSDKNREDILDFCVKTINGRVKIAIGAGSNNTEDTVKKIKVAKKYSPQAVLLVPPYYNKPNQSGLIAHFKAAAAEGLPIILYNIPGRTGLKLSYARLSDLINNVPEIKGIKESDFDINFLTEEAVRLRDKVELISGNDDLFPIHLALGYNGIISASGNVMADVYVAMYKNRNNPGKVMEIFTKAYDLLCACYLETNPTCVKYILKKMGICGDKVRLPLGPVAEDTARKIDKVLEGYSK